MSESTLIFDNIVTDIERAIESEVGEQRDFNEHTEIILENIESKLKSILDLPQEYHR